MVVGLEVRWGRRRDGSGGGAEVEVKAEGVGRGRRGTAGQKAMCECDAERNARK